jgi:hypothetical protein
MGWSGALVDSEILAVHAALVLSGTQSEPASLHVDEDSCSLRVARLFGVDDSIGHETQPLDP